MVYFNIAVLLFAVLCIFQVEAAPAVPVEARQLNIPFGGFLNASPGCNIARLRTVAGLTATTAAVAGINDSGAGATALADAKAGLADARAGIGSIAKALVAGQAPPQDGRDQTEAGLTAAKTALGQVAGNGGAMRALDRTIAAAQDVIEKC